MLSGDEIGALRLLRGSDPLADAVMADAAAGARAVGPGAANDAVANDAVASDRAASNPAAYDRAAALQPNGVDLSLEAVWRVLGRGSLGRTNTDRELPPREPLAFDADDWLELAAGAYGIRYAEWVELPTDCGGLCFPRSSLLRMGVHVPTAVWDAGYAGRGEGLLEVTNPHGVRLQRGARIVQLVVFRLSAAARSGYAGSYQHENAR